MYLFNEPITVASRESPLSKVQIKEVEEELKQHYPQASFKCIFLKTIGDRDRKTSLRTLGATDFFTKEIDEMQLRGACRIAIHSAKDLPNPLPSGLVIAALTKGVDSSDVLVLRDGDTIKTLPAGSVIATSSFRREENIRQIRPDFQFTDIRGYIEERLQKLFSLEVDGVVMAEAAILRLGLTHLNREVIPGEIAPFQGRLAIIARANDQEMLTLFRPLHHQKD